MANLLQGSTLDPDQGLYSARVLGFKGQDCQFDGVKISDTCMFKSSLPEIDLENWDDYFVCSLDLGYQTQGFLTHPQLGQVYVKPNTYNELTDVDIWIEIKHRSTTSPDFIGNEGVLGWFNFNKDNVINHPILTNINDSSMLGAYQDNLAVFMFSDTTQKYHAFICNAEKNVFISDGLVNLDAIFIQSVSFYPVSSIGLAFPLWSNSQEAVNVLENTTLVDISSVIVEGTEPISFSIDEDSEETFIVNEETGELNFRVPPDYEAGNNDYQVILTATNTVGQAALQLAVNVVNVSEIAPIWSESIEYINMLSSDSDVIFSTRLTQGEDPITYSISGSGVQDFNINPLTGEITFNAPAGFETTDYIITLTAENEAGSDSVDLYISVVKIFRPQTRQELKDAVDLWVSNKISALSKYGEINSWNTIDIGDMNNLFSGKSNFNDNISSWNTSNVKNMTGMFYGASSFNQPIGDWDTGKVAFMQMMFYGASSFNQPIGGWETGSVTLMHYMFRNASQFNQPIGGWDVSKVTNTSQMFYNASNFNQPIGGWETDNLKSVGSMFRDATSFNQPIGSWKTSKFTNASQMFYGASSFNQPIGDWDTGSIKNMYQTFFGCSNFNQPLDGWDVSNVTDMRYVFYNATSFNQSLDDWDVLNVTRMDYMFYRASVFNQPIGSWNVSSVTNMTSMFRYAQAFNQPIGDWETHNVTSMYYMFYQASAFNQPIGGWDVSNVNVMAGMFWKAYSFDQPINDWNVSTVSNMSSMFYDAIAFNQPIEKWNTIKLTNMERMFYGCSNFNQPIGGWETHNVTSMYYTFYNAKEFDQPIGEWDVSNVTRMTGMFRNAKKFNQNINDWELSSLTNKLGAWYMFSGATSFNSPLNKWDTSLWVSTRSMFYQASAFNQPLDNWNTSKIYDFNNMFYQASSFDQSLGNWDISSLEKMYAILRGVRLSTTNYDSLLNGWATLDLDAGETSIPYERELVAELCNYTNAGSAARDTLINTYRWTIVDGNLV